MTGRVLTSGPHGYLGKQFVAWQERHGWRPGYAWSPAAWRPRQGCGCPKPCGQYVRPGRGR